MSTKAARREYLQAVAEFERACRTFASGMEQVLEPQAPAAAAGLFGPRKPARRTARTPRAIEHARKA
ncbi:MULTISPECIES: hypothetical protein [unclassified Variovorax]|uniref:hypothetical protein n=1 Tax=unclassified Variovorax TaxID=663243 RepID=UPI00076C37B4|nr:MULTISPECIES: hypothetical protein [unclassified Variovorax]KWT64464.1 hypothetical protein APY03_7642 [Variovorax sp. WDL1]PNG56337.1 hypothetical protein CHC07_02753 [Variovorax sp. B4]PNG57761.1 hypothetical protein CHC06_02756 [Variovorax sp. B2]VTV09806.1 hypothetical protein WDL1CHR_00873 [Variovorax sp. WDL1]